MTKTVRGRHQQQTNPVGRAQEAADACREATREAHEVIKGMRETAADLRAALIETRHYVDNVVPKEVKRQLDLLGPKTEAAMRASVEKVTAEFDRLEAIMLGKDAEGPSLDAVAEAYALAKGADLLGRIRCPHCGTAHDDHTSVELGSGDRPCKGDSSVCANCYELSVFDIDVTTAKLILRKPTESEKKVGAKNRIATRQLAAEFGRNSAGGGA
jgi:hypothetical protein